MSKRNLRMSINEMSKREKYDRSIEEFAAEIEEIEQLSGRGAMKNIVYSITEQQTWEEKIGILSGQEFDNIGIGSATARKAVCRSCNIMETDLKKYVDEEGSLTEAVKNRVDCGDKAKSDRIDELYEDITDLKHRKGEDQVRRLTWVLNNYTCPWVAVFATVHDLKIGITHNTICMAAGQPRDYSVQEIRRGRAIYHESVNFAHQVKNGNPVTEPSVFRPFKPMKAKSKDPPEDTSDWLAQVKLDGYRCMIHVEGGRARAFSANVKEQTGVLPELEDIDWPSGKWIFDAEVVADDGDYVSTKERMQRDPSSNLPHEMNFWVFDVVMADGRDLSQEPFEQRMDILFKELPADESLVPVHAFEDIQQAMREADRNGYEGLIMKHRTHEIEFGQRSGQWLKDKITNETVDLRISGFENGTGRNADVLGALQLETEDGTDMGSVGTGFTDKQREEIWNNQYRWNGEIVEISFDGSEGYTDGLRFPAFEEKREDKMKADSFERLKNISGQY